ncbi:zinc ribbon domain-containing protein [Nocardioides aquiterrae]|uniref:NAD glycohydrolase translocation F5/8 type C domain-containing protein n=1 Tax=Nocardioides aquiterrae TaxID=203799 RepID=A0ABN1UHM3_9ACTN
MASCANCGHELGVGRFCTNCGHPVDAPPPAPPPPPSTPPPAQAGQVPPPPRYPLFADETEPAYVAPEPEPGPEPHPHRRPRPVWPFVVAAVALVLVAGVLAGVGLLAGGDDAAPGVATPTITRHGHPPSDPPAGGRLLAGAEVTVPATAPPNQDVSGNPTTYVGDNMLDGVPETCWRMPGDGGGEEITVTLPRQTHLRRVGLINGYAKTAQDARGHELDWYHGNRRVLRVEWVFDDGTTVSQDLADTEAVQSVDVDVTTTTVVLRLVSVSPPGEGRAARDYTAISDLSFVGT